MCETKRILRCESCHSKFQVDLADIEQEILSDENDSVLCVRCQIGEWTGYRPSVDALEQMDALYPYAMIADGEDLTQQTFREIQVDQSRSDKITAHCDGCSGLYLYEDVSHPAGSDSLCMSCVGEYSDLETTFASIDSRMNYGKW